MGKRDMMGWTAKTQEIYATCETEEEIEQICLAMQKIVELQRKLSRQYLEAGVLQLLNQTK